MACDANTTDQSSEEPGKMSATSNDQEPVVSEDEPLFFVDASGDAGVEESSQVCNEVVHIVR